MLAELSNGREVEQFERAIDDLMCGLWREHVKDKKCPDCGAGLELAPHLTGVDVVCGQGCGWWEAIYYDG